MKKLVQDNHGDTIVEVLIAIVILSLLLVGAYQTSNRSLADISTTSERAQALSIAQGQAEQLRAQLAALYTTNPSIVNASAAFCFSYDATSHAYDSVTIPSAQSDFVTDCSQAASAQSNSFSFTTEIQPQPVSGGGSSCISATNNNVCTFEITESWPGLTGDNNQLFLYYQIGVCTTGVCT